MNPNRHPAFARWLALAALVVVITGLLAARPGPAVVSAAQVPTATPGEQIVAVPTRTPLPPEYRDNGNQSLGIAFGGALLVLIVVSGVALFMPRDDQ